MQLPPHISPALVIGIGCLCLTVWATRVTIRMRGYPAGIRLLTIPQYLIGQLREDMASGGLPALSWVFFSIWSVGVSSLHFWGVIYGIYTAIGWWDLMTHAMGGFGVAGILALMTRKSTREYPSWLIPGVFAIGAGFEVYEFLFKSFWHHWSLQFYITDTIVDLIINTSGAVVVVIAVVTYARVGEDEFSSRTELSDTESRTVDSTISSRFR